MKPAIITALCICCTFTGFSQSIFKLVPGTDSMGWAWPVEFSNKLVFAAADTVNNYELWSYDGSNPVTKVYELNPSGSGIYSKGIVINNTFYFGGDDGAGGGWELYKWDGTNNPALVKDLNPVPNQGSYPFNF